MLNKQEYLCLILARILMLKKTLQDAYFLRKINKHDS